MKPLFFEKQIYFRNWLEQNHQIESELLVGFYKVGCPKPSMTWPQSVDEALCFGWIDGICRGIDSESYQIRFTPRKSNSIWSAVNIEKVEILTQQGQMHPAGLAIFEKRSESKSKIYAYENPILMFSDELETQFKTNQAAWDYFQALGLSYRRTSISWVMSAKQQATKIKRLQELMADSLAKTNKWKDYPKK